MAKQLRVCLDPGHGKGNVGGRTASGDYKYDTGATWGKVQEATVAMNYVNALKAILEARGVYVVRTRRDRDDPCPVGRRDDVARAYKAQVMISFHLNDGVPSANGTEVFFRGESDRAFAQTLAGAVAGALGTKLRGDKGAKTEKESQHKSLAVMEFELCWLIELGFGSNAAELAKILDPVRMNAVCVALADKLIAYLTK